MSDRFKEGVSVKELENFARKYTNEVFTILALILATFSSLFDFFTGTGWSLVFVAVGAILSLAFLDKAMPFVKKFAIYLFRQDKKTQYVIGIVRIILAIFLPFIVFAEIGILAGIAFHNIPKHLFGMDKEGKKSKENPSSEEEHL